jgi:hypothetical protein
MAREASLTPVDRTYSLAITIHTPIGKFPRTGMLHVRGAQLVVMEIAADQGTTLYGSDGEEFWTVPPSGPVVLRNTSDFVDLDESSAPWLTMDSLIAKIDSYDLEMTGEATLETHPGRQLLKVRAAAKPGRDDLAVRQADYWIDRDSDLVIRAELDRRPPAFPFRRTDVVVEFVGEQSRDDSFYRHESHHDHSRQVIRRQGRGRGRPRRR